MPDRNRRGVWPIRIPSREPGDLRRRWVHVLDHAVLVGHDDAVGRLFHRRRQHPRAVQFLALRADVPEDGDAAARFPAFVAQRARVHADPRALPVGWIPDQDRFVVDGLPADGARQRQSELRHGSHAVRPEAAVRGRPGRFSHVQLSERQDAFGCRVEVDEAAVPVGDDDAVGEARENVVEQAPGQGPRVHGLIRGLWGRLRRATIGGGHGFRGLPAKRGLAPFPGPAGQNGAWPRFRGLPAGEHERRGRSRFCRVGPANRRIAVG